MISIVPPHVQISLLLSFNAGTLAIATVPEPGVHGEGVFGIHGPLPVCGENKGFNGDVHNANGTIFTNGLLSLIFARGTAEIHLFCGKTFKVDGAIEKEQLIIAPPHTKLPKSKAVLSYTNLR